MLPWYCETSSTHLHSTEQEAAWCTELYELWQEALAHLMAYVREDEVAMQVNTLLADHPDGWGEE